MGPNTERKGRVRTELMAGVTTFFTVSCIAVVNPSILAAEGTGMPFDGVLAATMLACFTMTLLTGLYARPPFAVAPGMGINAFFAFTIVLIPLTFSITQGILWGFITHAGLYHLAGRAREVHPAMYALAAVSACLLLLGMMNAER